MNYNLDTKQAIFQDTCLLVKDKTKLSSLRALYNVKSDLAFFYDQVTVLDEGFKMKTDSLMYDTDIDRVYFIAPSYIQQDSKKIYCLDGFYDIEAKRAFFSDWPVYFDKDQYARSESMFYSGIDSITRLSGDAFVRDSVSIATAEYISLDEKSDDIILEQNARYLKEDKLIEGPYIQYNQRTEDVYLQGRSSIDTDDGRIEGDTIRYLKEADDGKIIGNAVWRDSSKTKSIHGDVFFYKETDSFFKAVAKNKRPLYKQAIDKDTLYFSADTLINASPGDTMKYMEAIRYVRIYKTDLQAVCDSLYYSDQDSTFHLLGNPIVWSDTIQFTGDTIKLVMKNDAISEIIASQNAFIISNEIEDYYNQIKAKQLHAYLDSNTLTKMELRGNAESLYLIKDGNDEYIGPNHTLCSEMDFYFADDDLTDIRYFTEPESNLVPMAKAGESDLRLENFKLYVDERPLNWKMVLQVKRTKQSAAVKKEELDKFEREVDKLMNRASKAENKSKKR